MTGTVHGNVADADADVLLGIGVEVDRDRPAGLGDDRTAEAAESPFLKKPSWISAVKMYWNSSTRTIAKNWLRV